MGERPKLAIGNIFEILREERQTDVCLRVDSFKQKERQKLSGSIVNLEDRRAKTFYPEHRDWTKEETKHRSSCS